jgi:hypothetical protein
LLLTWFITFVFKNLLFLSTSSSKFIKSNLHWKLVLVINRREWNKWKKNFIFYNLKNPKLVQIIDFQIEIRLKLIFFLFEYSSISAILSWFKDPSQTGCCCFFFVRCNAVEFLHFVQPRILHRDLKLIIYWLIQKKLLNYTILEAQQLLSIIIPEMNKDKMFKMASKIVQWLEKYFKKLIWFLGLIFCKQWNHFLTVWTKFKQETRKLLHFHGLIWGFTSFSL